jgi:hypothetical protein
VVFVVFSEFSEGETRVVTEVLAENRLAAWQTLQVIGVPEEH